MNTKVYIALFSILLFAQLRAQQDVGVSQINNPTSGCQVGNASTNINVIVRNYSATSAFPNTISVKYTINSGPVHSELIGALLGPNASFNFTFFQTENFSACGNYQLKIWAVKAGDPNHANDTLNYLFVNECNITPGIITGPSNLCYGINNDSLKVTGGTFSYTYQWYKKSPIPGAFVATGNTTNTFYLNGLTDTSAYYVRYLGVFCPSVNSAVFGVGISPTIVTGSPSPDLSLCIDNVVGNVSVSGFTQNVADWEQSNNGGATWISTGNAVPSLNINYLTNSALFRAKVASGTCGTKYSDTISVEVQPLVIPGTISGATNVCYGTNVTNLTLSGNANDYGFEWYSSTDNITFTPTGITSPLFTAYYLTQDTYYKVVLQGDQCSDVETPVVTLIVDPAINTGTMSPNLTVCETNISGTVSISGYVDTLLIWQQSNDGGLTWFSTGISTDTLDISFLSNSALFRAQIQSGTCGIDYSYPVSVTVQPTLIPGAISGANAACISSSTDTLLVSGYNYSNGFQWYFSYDAVNYIAANVTGTTYSPNINQTTHFYVIVNGGICANDTTLPFTYTVYPALNVGTPSADLDLCSNNIVGNVSISGFSSSILDWEQSNDGGLTWFSTGDNSVAHDISGLLSTAHFRALVESGLCGSGYSATIAVTIYPAIIPGVISAGSNLCFGVNSDTLILTGNANDFGFEWYSSLDNITFTPTGLTNDTLIVTNLTQTTYYKVILNGIGCPDDETNTTSIVVSAPLNLGITSADLTLCASNIVGNVSISGYATSIVDWEQSNDGGLTWFTTGINTPSLDISYLTASADFRANIESGACGSGISDTISVVIENPIVPGVINGNGAFCAGPNSDTLILTGNAFDFGFQWYSATLNATFLPTGVTNDTLIITNLTETTFYKVILNGNVCSDSETAVFTVTLDPPLNLGSTSADLQLCSSNISGNISNTGFSSNFVGWEQSNDGGLTWISTGSTNNPYDISYLTASADFRAVISSGSCGTGYSDTISITIENAIIPGFVSSSNSVCSGNNSDTLILVGNSNGTSFQWYSSILNNSYIPTGVFNDTLIVSNITQTTEYKVITLGNICPNEETNIITLTVNPSLNLGTTSPDLNLCSSNVIGTISLSGYVSNLLNWEQSNDGGLTWVSTGASTPTVDISYLTASALFRALVQSGGCGSGYSDTISVFIENAVIPGTVSSSSFVCSGNNSDTLILTGNSNGTSFQWYYSTLNTSFAPTGVFNDTLIFSNLTETTEYKVITLGNICPADESNIITITVNPSLNVGTTSPDLNLCSSNISGSISLSGYVANLLDWEQSNDGGTTWFSTGFSTPVLNISFLTASAHFRALVQSGGCGSGYSDTISVFIENAIVPGSISGPSVLCYGNNNDTLILSGYSTNFGFEWFSATLNTSFFPTGVTNDTFIISNLGINTDFKVIFQGNICPNDETTMFTVTVDPTLNLGTGSADLELCTDNLTGTVAINGYSSVLSNWEQSNDGGITWFTTGSNSNPLDISYLTASADFRANISSGACGTGISDTISVTIEDAIIPGLISGESTLCIGINADTLILNGNANDFGFEWYSATLNTSFTPTGITNDTLILTNLSVTTYFKVVLQGNICSDAETPVFTVQVFPPVSAGTVSPDLVLCENNVVGSLYIYGYSTDIVDWEQSDDGGITWTPVGNTTSTHDISYLTSSALFRVIIESGPCGTAISDTISVTIDDVGVPATIGFNFDACYNSSDLDSMKILSYTGNILSWQASTDAGVSWSNIGNGDSILYVSYITQSTLYHLVTSHGACPNVASNNVVVTLNPLPAVSAGQDTAMYLGSATYLNGSGGLMGVWTPNTNLSNPSLPNPNCYPFQTTTYAYTVIDNNGCTNTDYVTITIIIDTVDYNFIVYNIVTPNGDGKNDFFTIEGIDKVEDYLIRIFNANGNLIFESNDYNNDWGATYKGEIVPDGTYLYAVEVENLTKYRGFLTIMKGID